jgi:Tfp pilus assembly PilM family ATPase/Tfp pilus assembly protein PilN
MWHRRVLGLDVGTSSVKVAQVMVSATGRRTLTRLALCQDQEALSRLLEQRIWREPGDRVHLGFPSEQVVARKLKLPFKDPAKIQQILPLELEGEVPFPLEEIVAGYLVQEKGDEGTTLLSLVSPRAAVVAWLDRFRSLGIDPAVLEPESVSLTRLLPKGAPDAPESFGVLDVGAAKTNLLFFHRGKVQALRCIHRGLGTSPAALPLHEGITGEIHRTLMAIRARGDAPWPQALYLSGGVATLPEAPEWLEAQWGIPARTLSPLDAIPSALVAPLEAHPAIFSAAIGLAMIGDRRSAAPCNLRVGEFSYRPGLSLMRGRSLAAAILCFLAVGLGLGDLYAHQAIREKALRALQNEVRLLFRQVFSEGAYMADPVRQIQRLLEERKAKHLTLLGQDPRGTAVELLRELSLREQAKTIRLTEFDLTGEVISLRGEANSYDTIEKAKDHWQASPLLEAVEIKSAKKNPKSQLWDFQCSARRKLS